MPTTLDLARELYSTPFAPLRTVQTACVVTTAIFAYTQRGDAGRPVGATDVGPTADSCATFGCPLPRFAARRCLARAILDL